MKIQYLGHASFRLVSQFGYSVVCDPYDEKLVGYAMPQVNADVVTVSHSHSDHNYLDGVLGNPSVIDQAGVCNADDICIESFVTFHDHHQGTKRGKNLVFKFLVEGISIAHMGDIGAVFDDVVQKLAGVDILMIPVGGFYTIDAFEAKEYIDAIKPKIVLPMHFRANGTLEIEQLDDFLKLFKNTNTKVVIHKADTLELLDQPQNKATQIVVLPKFEN